MNFSRFIRQLYATVLPPPFERRGVHLYFNLGHAALAFVTMSVSIFLLNLYEGTVKEALGAGLAQGLLSFTIVGFNTAFFELLQKRYHNGFSILFPAVANSLLSLITHLINRSPQPYLTAVFVFFTAAGNFSLLCYCREVHRTISLRYLTRWYVFRRRPDCESNE